EAQDEPSSSQDPTLLSLRHGQGESRGKCRSLKEPQGPPFLPCTMADEAIAEAVPAARVPVDLGHDAVGKAILERRARPPAFGEIEEVCRGAKDRAEVVTLQDRYPRQAPEIGEALQERAQRACWKGWVHFPLIAVGCACRLNLRGQRPS